MTIFDLFIVAILTAVVIGAFGLAGCLCGAAVSIFRDIFGGIR